MQILSTKLFVPPLRSKLVARPRLIQKLNQGWECGFVLISAPAGYGKSTLLSAWLSQMKSPAVWYSLDDGDNEPVRFLTYLAAALGKVEPSVGDALANALQSSPPPDVEHFLTPVVNLLAQVNHSFWVILDDYHVIQNQEVHRIVSFLLENRPPSLHLAIATRADPHLSLSRLRARSAMVELRQSDLRFTLQEAVEFFNYTMGIRVLSEDAARLTDRTEGWIAGLQIAALSIQNTDDVSGFITSFTRYHHHIFDYLLEEILERQSPEIRRFLLYTSIPDQVTAPLCDALLKDDNGFAVTRSSMDILEELEHANLFILALDHEHRWYRYHHLFSDLLRLMLDKTYPNLSVELHLRACLWYEAQGMLSEALHHALSSGDLQQVAKIISANVLALWESHEIGPILEKLDSLPPDEMSALPWLGIARVWALGAGQLQKSQQILDAIEMRVENAPETIDHQRMKGHIAAARAYMLGTQGDRSNAIAHAKAANELLPPDEMAVRAMNLTVWGDMLTAPGKDSTARPILEQALALALQAKKAHIIMLAAVSLASVHMFAGRLHEVHRVCLEALAIAEDYQRHFQHPLSAAAVVYSLVSGVFVEWHENEKAIQYAQKGVMLSEYWGRINPEAISLVYLGRALMYNNDREQAYRALERAGNLAHQISSKYGQAVAIFILEAMLDCETPDASEIARQDHYLKESGAQFPAHLTARLLLRNNQPGEALLVLEQALLRLGGQPSFDTVRIYALRGLAYQAKGDEKQAMASLRQALEMGDRENRIATFVREGAAMERLIRLAQAKGIAPEFNQRLLAAFESRRKHKPSPALVSAAMVEPLSAREMDVLKLLAQGFSDKNIALALAIARETVHKHLKNIYGKLDVHSRTEAIARARELGLL